MNKNRIKQVFGNNCIRYGITLIAGLALGGLIFSGGSDENHSGHTHQLIAGENEKQVWTCSMHPQIKMDKPGKCPICGMDLIPLKRSDAGDAAVDADAIQLSKEAVALANIQTTKVSRRNPVKDVRLYGTIQPDERLSQSQTSHVNGRIEKLLINFTGESVRRGQTIATIYSPELLSAQQELLEAAKAQSLQPALLQAAREKLRLWKLTDEQIAQIEQSGNASPLVEVKANTGGIVVGKKVSQGDYVNQGNVLFDIADLSQVWAVFDAYESDLPFLKVGDRLEYTLQALPGRTFSGRISFINPIIDPTTRTAKIRTETNNPDMRLKPEMYADAIVKAPLQQYNNKLVIPKSAVLWTGKRSIVYVKQPDTETPAFMLRQIELGPSLGQAYVVLSGLEDGDEIVTNGTFTIDAGAQLEGKRSMMNEDPPHPATGHAMITVQGNCDMCKARIESAAKTVNGVTSAVWDKKSKQLHIDFSPAETSIDNIGKAVAKAGHDTDKHKADKVSYDALPGCCKYRN
jgi:Cu(I)/Ag(I) efflux system membrane fusion protein